MISETDLILNKDGSIYHLGLLPEQVCKNIIFVGDPDRVAFIEPYMDRVFYKHRVREFCSMMGEVNGKEYLVISTGIGTDNIDIVLTELDALVNIDFKTREIKKRKTTLSITRIGTSGCLQEEIPVDSLLVSTHGVGLDVLMQYYTIVKEAEITEMEQSLNKLLKKEGIASPAYVAAADEGLLKKYKKSFYHGMTATMPGFYGPQGRQVRATPRSTRLLDRLKEYTCQGHIITNLEMETAGIYGLAGILGHKAISLNALLANRARKEFSKNPEKTVKLLIEHVLG